MSEPHVVYHGDTLRLAGTTFDLHIHQRAETCSGCEPGCSREAHKGEVQEESECGSLLTISETLCVQHEMFFIQQMLQIIV